MARQSQATIERKDAESSQSLTVHNQEVDTPVLPIEHIERLQSVRPDLVDWLIQQTTTEANFRRERQIEMDHAITAERKRGQYFGFIIGICGVLGGAVTAMLGHDWAGGVIASVSIGTLAVAFLRKNK